MDKCNFVGIQQSQAIAAEGYVPSPVRTGYEQVVAHRTDDIFAYSAKQDGKVIEVTDELLTIEYKDGTRKSVEIGRRFGVASESNRVVPHQIATQFKAGQSFKKGDILTYNTGFFEPDRFNPGQVVWKVGILAKTALMETAATLEDSSIISEKAAKALTTYSTTVRLIKVRFDQTIRNLVKVGTEVDFDSILCTIEDSTTADNSLFDEDQLDALRVMGSHAPRAKAIGTVERIEVFYHGDKEDMSESLRKIANASDRRLSRQSRAKGGKPITGQVDDSLRVEGRPLGLDNMLIKVYITGPVPAGVGDKGVFGNQLKTVFGSVMTGINRTESGEDLDAIFSFEGIAARIVLSPEIMGTTNTLLKVLSKKVAEVYRGTA